MIVLLMTRMIFFSIGFLYNVFKYTTVAMLASVIVGFVVITLLILWFIWTVREVHIFRRLVEFFNGLIVGDSQP